MNRSTEKIVKATKKWKRPTEALGEKNDCTVRAISCAFNLPYSLTHEFLEANGREYGHGICIEKIMPSLLCDDVTQWFAGMNLSKSLDRMKYGTFLVLIPRHMLCVKNGKIISDNFANSNSKIRRVYYIENSK